MHSSLTHHPRLIFVGLENGNYLSLAFSTVHPPKPQKYGCPAATTCLRHSIDTMRTGQHGSWVTSTRPRKCMSLVILDNTVSCVTRNMKIRSPFASHFPRLGSASAVLTLRRYLSGTRYNPLSIGPKNSRRGAYSPRTMRSNLHSSPADAMRMFKDVNTKKAGTVHWE